MLGIGQIDHIVLNVRDLDRMLHFYHNILGLPTVRLEEYRAGKVPFVSVRVNEQVIIDLFPPEFHRKIIGEGLAENLNHFCLVTNNEDLQPIIDHLQAQHIEIEQGPVSLWGARGMGTSIFFRDPDGNRVEIRTYNAAAESLPAAQA